MEKTKGMVILGGRKVTVYETDQQCNYTTYHDVKSIEILTVNGNLLKNFCEWVFNSHAVPVDNVL